MRTWLRNWVSLNPSRVFLREWLATAAVGRDSTFHVLDAGAGEAPYRELFDHVTYETADFAQVAKPYTPGLTYICDLAAIPVEDGRYDLVVCSQVLEHVPEPMAVLNELVRVAKPGGEIWMSAPLFYAEHEEPYDFHRFTQFAWRRMAKEAGLEILDLAWLEGYYTTLAYQLSTAARVLPRHMLPLRALFLLLAVGFARLDLRSKAVDRGMCKNYRVILGVPQDGSPLSSTT